MMAGKSAFRTELENAVLERHCANHPMTEKWAMGELGRNARMRWFYFDGILLHYEHGYALA